MLCKLDNLDAGIAEINLTEHDLGALGSGLYN